MSLSRTARTLLPFLLPLLTGQVHAAYTNTQYGFTVSAPKNWQQVSYPGTAAVFTGPAAGGFSSNINVVVTKLPAGFTLQDYERQGREQMAAVITNYKFIGRRSLSVGGLPAFEQTFTGQQGKFNLYYIQTVTLKGGNAYVLTGTGLQTAKATIVAAMPSFVKGFSFKK